MDLTDYLRLFRKRLALIALVALLGALLAATISLVMPRKYEAHSQLFISTQGQDSTSLLQGSSFSQQRVKSYGRAMTTPLVLDPVREQLGLTTSVEELSRQIEAVIPLDTVLIDLTVTDEDPVQAAAIANAVSEEFRLVVPTLENTAQEESPVRVTILEQATASDDPTSPNVALNIAAGLALGLLCGLGLSLLREMTDTMVRTEGDALAITDKVIIGGIPNIKQSKGNALVVHEDPLSTRAEAYRAVRTNLQFVDAANPARSIVFTSSVPGEGKTTTVTNVALALAEGGARVCLVEADLRRPRVTSNLGLVDDVGLTNLIVGDADYEDVKQPVAGTNLVVIGAGPIPPNPSELLGSPAMNRIIATLLEDYDFVLFDAPPLLPVTDAAVLSKQVGGAVLVIGTGIVRKEQLRKTLDILATVEARVLGLVLTRLPGKGAGSYSYYSQGYESDPVHNPRAPRTTAKARRLNRAT